MADAAELSFGDGISGWTPKQSDTVFACAIARSERPGAERCKVQCPSCKVWAAEKVPADG